MNHVPCIYSKQTLFGILIYQLNRFDKLPNLVALKWHMIDYLIGLYGSARFDLAWFNPHY